MQVNETELPLDMHDFDRLDSNADELEYVRDQERENVEAKNEAACFLVIEVPFDRVIDSFHRNDQKDRADVVDDEHS